jgi:nitronate monooxygenase
VDPDGHVIKRYDANLPVDETEGETEAMAMYAGQSAGGIEAVQSATTVVSDLVEEAKDTIEDVGQLTQ